MIDCIFCKIIKGGIPNYTVYQDENVLAFLDINPHAKGHTVVAPKAHKESFFEFSEDEIKLFFVGVKRAIDRIEEVLHPDGYNVGWNEKPAGGQVVPHLHLHIFPRYQDDGGGSVHSIIKNPGDVKVDEVAKMFL